MAIAPGAEDLPNPGPLTEGQRKLIKATVPVLEQHGDEITRVFYKEMLEANPILRNVFNHTKQQVRLVYGIEVVNVQSCLNCREGIKRRR